MGERDRKGRKIDGEKLVSLHWGMTQVMVVTHSGARRDSPGHRWHGGHLAVRGGGRGGRF